jgi:hypothetical protein
MSASVDSWLLSGLAICLFNFQGVWTIATKAGELDLAIIVQAFCGTQYQVTLEANGLMRLSSDFDPANV